jgi:cytochrome P450
MDFLLRNTDERSDVLAELDANERTLYPLDIFREPADLLPYMQAVIKETLRLHPSIGLILKHHIPLESTIIPGKFRQGGAT